MPLGIDTSRTNLANRRPPVFDPRRPPLAVDDGYNFLRASHSAPFGIKYWELGNECYGTWKNTISTALPEAASRARLTSLHLCPVLRLFFKADASGRPNHSHRGRGGGRKDPHYGIGTHGVANPYEGNSAETGPDAGHARHSEIPRRHPAIHDLPLLPAGNPGSEDDAVLLQAGPSIPSDAANLRQMITDYGATSGTSIELDVTELNSVSSNPGKQSTSLVNGLFMADAIGNLAQTEFNACTWWAFRGGSVTNANNSSQLYGWREYGDYGVLASGDLSGVPANSPYPHITLRNCLPAGDAAGTRLSAPPVATASFPSTPQGSSTAASRCSSSIKTPPRTSPRRSPSITSPPAQPPSQSIGTEKPTISRPPASPRGPLPFPVRPSPIPSPSYSMSVLVVKSQFENWREQNFTTSQLKNWSLSGDTGNPSGDGIPNLMKYALALNPNKPATSGLPLLGQVAIGGKTYLTLTFTDQAALTDIAYTVQVSSDLQNWQSGASIPSAPTMGRPIRPSSAT